MFMLVALYLFIQSVDDIYVQNVADRNGIIVFYQTRSRVPRGLVYINWLSSNWNSAQPLRIWNCVLFSNWYLYIYNTGFSSFTAGIVFYTHTLFNRYSARMQSVATEMTLLPGTITSTPYVWAEIYGALASKSRRPSPVLALWRKLLEYLCSFSRKGNIS